MIAIIVLGALLTCVSLLCINVFWLISYSMNNDELPVVKNYVSYRIFKRKFNEMSNNFYFNERFHNSIFGKGVYLHADIFELNGEHYYFLTPIGYLLAKILMHKTCKKHFSKTVKRNFII